MTLIRMIPERPATDAVLVAAASSTSLRLGRHVEHDPASKAYPAERAAEIVSVLHKRHSHPFDQGQLGSCTGNAITGVLDTEPFTHKYLGERTALKIYKLGTVLDGIPGAYPPDDTGSSGLGVAKAAKKLGYISRYAHAFGLQHALEALSICSLITGVKWWSSMDEPDVNDGGLVTIAPGAYVRGGHEFQVLGNDVERKRVRCCNSWGPEWGDGGYFELDWATWGELLDDQGDATTVAL